MRELKQGHPVAVHPEGIAGIFQGASPTREQIYVKDRKGFVKLAIQTDAGGPPAAAAVLATQRSEWVLFQSRISVKGNGPTSGCASTCCCCHHTGDAASAGEYLYMSILLTLSVMHRWLGPYIAVV